MIVTDKPGDPLIVFPWVARRAHLMWSADTVSVGEMRNGELIAGVTYNGFLGGCCQMHVAIEGRMSRAFVHACFHYPFEQLGLACVLGIVPESNLEAIKFDRHLGFETLCRIKHGGPGGEDVLLLELRREKCRFIGERYGRRKIGSACNA